MIRAKIHSYANKEQGHRVWFYDVFDTNKPKNSRNLIGGLRLTQQEALHDACTYMKYRSQRDAT